MRKSESKEIGGHRYTVRQFGALEGRKILAKLGKLMGGMLVGQGNVADGLARIDEVELAIVCDSFAKYTDVQVGSKEPILIDVFDEHFAGKYEDMMEWLAFAFEVNYSGFLSKMGAKLSGDSLIAQAKQPPQSE